MRVIVFGATGKTGQPVCRRALAQGYQVTAFTRSAHKLEEQDAALEVVQGDVMDGESVAAALAGHDAAIVALGSNGLRDKTTLTAGTANIVAGMSQKNVGRLVVLSAAGVGESWRQVPWLARLMFRTLLRNIYADHTAQEKLVRESPLDWTIVRAAILSDGPASGRYTADNARRVGRISREDLAHFLVAQVQDETHRKQAISVTS